MNLESLLSPERSAYYTDPISKETLLARLSHLISADLGDFVAHELFKAYLAREAESSTALEYGLAIPHVRARFIETPRAALIRLQHPVAFVDGKQPIDLIIGLALPDPFADHLKILAEIAGLFRHSSVRDRLRITEDASKLYQALWSTDVAA